MTKNRHETALFNPLVPSTEEIVDNVIDCNANVNSTYIRELFDIECKGKD